MQLLTQNKQCKRCKDSYPQSDFIVSHITMEERTICRKCRLKEKQEQKRSKAIAEGRTFIPRAKWDAEAEQIRCRRIIERELKEIEKKNNKSMRDVLIEGTGLYNYIKEQHPQYILLSRSEILSNKKLINSYRSYAYNKKYYAFNSAERLRTKIYKMLNPQTYYDYNKRYKQLTQQSDNTITRDALNKLLEETVTCPYCDYQLDNDNKSFDHLDPICKGGLHSINNIIVCCEDCNQKRKRTKPFHRFILELSPEKQQSLINTYNMIKDKR